MKVARGVAIEVACPICGAEPGTKCKTVGGGPQKIAHHLRTAIAQREAGVALSWRARDQLNRAGMSTKGEPARMRCDSCGGRGYVPAIVSDDQGEDYGSRRCRDCGGTGERIGAS